MIQTETSAFIKIEENNKKCENFRKFKKFSGLLNQLNLFSVFFRLILKNVILFK